MNSRRTLILVIAILETVLLFFVAILSNKISNVLDITPKLTLVFTVIGLILLCIVGYIKSTGTSLSQAFGIKNEILLNRPGPEPKTLEIHQRDEPFHGTDSKQEESASNQFMYGGIIVGILLACLAFGDRFPQNWKFWLIWFLALIGSIWYSSYPTWRLPSTDKELGVWKYVTIPVLVYCYSFWFGLIFAAIGWGLFSLLRWITNG